MGSLTYCTFTKYEGRYKSNGSNFFFPPPHKTVVADIFKFMHILGIIFTRLRLTSTKSASLSTHFFHFYFSPYKLLAYSILLKLRSSSLMLCSARLPQNSVLGTHPSEAQRAGSWKVLNQDHRVD